MIGFPSLEGTRDRTWLYRPLKELWDALQTVYFGRRDGVVTLVGDVTVVKTTAAKKSSVIHLTPEVYAGTPGALSAPPSMRVEGVSFTVVSTDVLDRSQVAWTVSNLR